MLNKYSYSVCAVLQAPKFQDTSYPYEKTARGLLLYESHLQSRQLQCPLYPITRNAKCIQQAISRASLKPVIAYACRCATNIQPSRRCYSKTVEKSKLKQPGQSPVANITYIKATVSSVYMVVMMDISMYDIRGHHLSHSVTQDLAFIELSRALTEHVSVIHHTCQKTQCAIQDYATRVILNVALCVLASLMKLPPYLPTKGVWRTLPVLQSANYRRSAEVLHEKNV
jgi:hypothetical protein